MALSVLDEVVDFACRLGVDDAPDARPARGLQEPAAIGNHGDVMPGESGIGAQQLRRVVRLKLEEVVSVEDAREHVGHVVGGAMIGGQTS